MIGHINALEVRRRLGKDHWGVPIEFGEDGWIFRHVEQPAQIIVTYGDIPGVTVEAWLHASISHRDRLPTYDELAMLHRAVWQDQGYAYQVFAPKEAHVNIHEHALHLWGKPNGKPLLPEFGLMGTI